jgi:hypothetical protein
MRVNDHTTVVSCDPPTRLVLTARARPLGVVRAELRITAEARGARIELHEDLIEGWGTRMPWPSRLIQYLRNRRSVRRLAVVAERSEDRDRRSVTRASRR